MNGINFILHIDTYLYAIVQNYASLTYLFLFAIIFFETGFVITPFLPGDSLLFAAGAIAANGSLNITTLFITVFCAAIIGDTVNYHIGKKIGPAIFNRESSWLFNKKHLEKAQTYYAKHGKKAIILARFIPIIRTFAPFVAGIGSMPYRTFIMYNVIGGFFWCGLFIFSGFIFGSTAWVQAHFSALVIAIILISLIPFVYDIAQSYFHKQNHS